MKLHAWKCTPSGGAHSKVVPTLVSAAALQEDGLVVLAQAGLDLKRVERYVQVRAAPDLSVALLRTWVQAVCVRASSCQSFCCCSECRRGISCIVWQWPLSNAAASKPVFKAAAFIHELCCMTAASEQRSCEQASHQSCSICWNCFTGMPHHPDFQPVFNTLDRFAPSSQLHSQVRYVFVVAH